MKRQFKVGFAALAVATAACSDGGPTGPGDMGLAYVTTEVCETITFNTTAGAADHGGLWAGTTIFGGTVTASGTRFVDPAGANGGAIAPRLFYSPIQTAIEDDDLQYPAVGDCVDCQTLDLQSFLVIPDNRVHATPFYWGDYRYGGTIQLDFSGFEAGTYYVKSWHAVDDDGGEPSIDLFADGVPVSSSTGTGDAEVETVTSASKIYFNTSLSFEFGTEAQDEVTGSGGVDNVVVCKEVDVPSGEGTRTPGYWKNDKKDWPVDEVTIGGVVYSREQADDLMEAPTAGDKTYNMFEQLVATTLNLANGTDGSCIEDVVDEANAWMTAHPVGSGVTAGSSAWKNPEGANTLSASAIHSTLDQYNNGLLCAPHAD